MSKIVIKIKGYGKIKVKRPQYLDDASLIATVADAVAQTCTLIDPKQWKDKFHPVLGVGGYVD